MNKRKERKRLFITYELEYGRRQSWPIFRHYPIILLVVDEVIKESFTEDGWQLDQDSNRLPVPNKPRALKLHSPESFGVKVGSMS
jgi:hypothetical protein